MSFYNATNTIITLIILKKMKSNFVFNLVGEAVFVNEIIGRPRARSFLTSCGMISFYWIVFYTTKPLNFFIDL